MKIIRYIAIAIALISTLVTAFQNDHGEKIDFFDSEIFYEDPISKAQAQKTGKVLKDLGVFNPNSGISVKLTKEKNGLNFSFVINKSFHNDSGLHEQLRIVGGDVQASVFPKNKLTVHVTDEYFKPVKSLKPLISYKLNQRQIFAPKKHLNRATSLLQIINKKKLISQQDSPYIILDKIQEGWNVKIKVPDSRLTSQALLTHLTKTKSAIEELAFGGKSINLQLTDQEWRVKKTLKHLKPNLAH